MISTLAPRQALVWAGSFALALTVSSQAFGQHLHGTDTTLVPFVPAAGRAVAPNWVRPGLQLTYYGGTAIIPNDYHFYFRDPNGGWVDEEGNRYRQEEATGHGACGHTQVTVAAVDSAYAALDIRSYSLRPVALGMRGCCVGPAGSTKPSRGIAKPCRLIPAT